ncbi:hypothetical protein F4801DRAFT_380185 [Xylaria longipes]|nr:hypothetical protein F4801DRAFT_380185 [Xylaria longipes]
MDLHRTLDSGFVKGFRERIPLADQSCPAYKKLTEDVSGMADALGLQPPTPGGRNTLADLVYQLEYFGFMRDRFVRAIETYNWASHEHDPAAAVAIQDVYYSREKHSLPEETQWFYSACINHCHCEVRANMDMLANLHGEDFSWFPRRGTRRYAFAYVLFLCMYLRSGKAPTAVSKIYSDALSYLGSLRSDL